MSIRQAVSQLLEIEAIRQEGILSPNKTLAISLSRVGGGETNERIVCGTLAELASQSNDLFGMPLHSLVIVGRRLHHLEVEFAEGFALSKQSWREVATKVYGCVLD
jgi:diphthine methyl ester synthase